MRHAALLLATLLGGCSDAYTIKVGHMYSYASPAAQAMGPAPAPSAVPSVRSARAAPSASFGGSPATTPEELDAVSCAVIAWQPGTSAEQCRRDLAAARERAR
jgi:hypothetical protein